MDVIESIYINIRTCIEKLVEQNPTSPALGARAEVAKHGSHLSLRAASEHFSANLWFKTENLMLKTLFSSQKLRAREMRPAAGVRNGAALQVLLQAFSQGCSAQESCSTVSTAEQHMGWQEEV